MGARGAVAAACLLMGMGSAGALVLDGCGASAPVVPVGAPTLAAVQGHWEAMPSGTHANLWDVAFGSAQRGWAVGEGVVLGTGDGGLTWEVQVRDANLFTAVAALGPEHAWALGVDLAVWETTDGTTWHALQPGGWMMFQQGLAASPGRAWLVGQDSIFTPNAFRSTDGASWAVAAPLPLGNHEGHLADVALTPDGAIVVGSTWNGRGVLARTADDGASWCLVQSDLPGPLTSIALQGLSGWATGWGALGAGTLYRSVDGGTSWAAHPLPFLAPLLDVAVHDANLALAVGADGHAVRADAAGLLWHYEETPTSRTLRGVAFAPAPPGQEPVAFAVGDEGTLLRRG